MRPPTLDGVIERRLLINYRVDPDAIGRLLPAGFRPQLVNGSAVAGICILRLGGLRPHGAPRWLGFRSENAAHRIAVEWDGLGGVIRGVYIPRRDSASFTNVLVGGRLFPGVHHRARFVVEETGRHLSVSFGSLDGHVGASVRASLTDRFDGSRLFADLSEASDFFRAGSIGYSDGSGPGRLDGLQLQTSAWSMEPLELLSVQSSFFDAGVLISPGAAELDCGFVMRNVPVTWMAAEPIQLVSQRREAA